MTRPLIIILLLTSFFPSCNSQTSDQKKNVEEATASELKKWFENPTINNEILDPNLIKQLQDSGQIDNGQKSGKWIQYSLDTLLQGQETTVVVGDKKLPMNLNATLQKEIGNYINGKREGTWVLYKSYDKKIPLYWEKWSETNFHLGQKNGKEIISSFKDTIMVRTFINGQEEGIGKVFDINSPYKLQQVYNAHNGQFKLLEEYYRSGNIKFKFTDTVVEGRHLDAFKTYYETGQIESEGFKINDKLDGNYKYYHDNGQLWTEEILKEGNTLEVISNYDSKGKKKDKGTLKNGTGTIKLYDNDGNLKKTEVYVNGQEKK